MMKHKQVTIVLAVLLGVGCNTRTSQSGHTSIAGDTEREMDTSGLEEPGDPDAAAHNDADLQHDIETDARDATDETDETDARDATGADVVDESDATADATVGADATPVREICDNGLDDDGNAQVDCADAACERRPVCDHFPAYILTVEGGLPDGWELSARSSDALSEPVTLATYPPNTAVRSLCAHRELPLIAFDVSSADGANLIVWDLREASFIAHPSPFPGGAGSSSCTWLDDSSIATAVRFGEDGVVGYHLWMLDVETGWAPAPFLTEVSTADELRAVGRPVSSATGDRVYFQVTTGFGDPFTGTGWTSVIEEYVFETGERREVLDRVSYSLEYSVAAGRFLWFGPGGSGWFDDEFDEFERLRFTPLGNLYSLGLTRFVQVGDGALAVISETGAVLGDARLEGGTGVAVLPGRVGDFDLFFE